MVFRVSFVMIRHGVPPIADVREEKTVWVDVSEPEGREKRVPKKNRFRSSLLR
jgi:hypothetical protein